MFHRKKGLRGGNELRYYLISNQNKKVELFLSYYFYPLLLKTSYLIATIIQGLKAKVFHKFFDIIKFSYKQTLAITEIKVMEYRYNYLTKKVFFLLQLH
jgi:hypothetical protein